MNYWKRNRRFFNEFLFKNAKTVSQLIGCVKVLFKFFSKSRQKFERVKKVRGQKGSECYYESIKTKIELFEKGKVFNLRDSFFFCSYLSRHLTSTQPSMLFFSFKLGKRDNIKIRFSSIFLTLSFAHFLSLLFSLHFSIYLNTLAPVEIEIRIEKRWNCSISSTHRQDEREREREIDQVCFFIPFC